MIAAIIASLAAVGATGLAYLQWEAAKEQVAIAREQITAADKNRSRHDLLAAVGDLCMTLVRLPSFDTTRDPTKMNIRLVALEDLPDVKKFTDDLSEQLNAAEEKFIRAHQAVRLAALWNHNNSGYLNYFENRLYEILRPDMFERRGERKEMYFQRFLSAQFTCPAFSNAIFGWMRDGDQDILEPVEVKIVRGTPVKVENQ